MNDLHENAITSRDVTVYGIPVQVLIVPDAAVTPAEYDCYQPADIEAFRAGKWSYVGMVVRHKASGIEESLWAIEWGELNAGVDMDLDYYLAPEREGEYIGALVAELLPSLRALRDQLIALPLDREIA